MSAPLDSEIAVIGLGSMGSMALWRSALRGQSVQGFEQFNVGHDRSAAGAETRQFRAHLLEPFVLPHMALSERLYRELEATTSSQLLVTTGGLTFGAPDSPIISSTLARAESEDYPVELLTATQLREQHPQHRIADTDIAIFDTGSGYVRSEFSVVAAARAAEQLGAKIHSRTAVTSVRQEDGYVLITTDRDQYRVGKAIITAGPWSERLGGIDEADPHIRRMIMTWFPAIEPAHFTAGVFPTWSIALEDGTPAFGVPTVDNGSVKVAIVETYGNFSDADQLDYGLKAGEVDRVTQLVGERFAGLVPSAIRQSVHMDLYTADEQPVVGIPLATPDILIATGFSGRGFKLAPAIGEIAAAAVADGSTELLIPEWSPERFRP